MFSWRDFQIAFLLCLLLMAARRLLGANARNKNTVLLPRSQENIFLLHLRWIIPFFRRSRGTGKNTNLLGLISSLALPFKERGLVHLSIPFFDMVILFHPDTVQPLLQSPSNVDKPIFYHFFEEWLGPSIFFSNRSTWHKRRKLLTPAFHLEILENSILVFEKQSKTLVEKLAQEGASGDIDIVPLITDCVMNIICETAMGLSAGGSTCDLSTLEKHMAILCNIVHSRICTIWRWPDVIFRFSEKGRQYRRSLKVIREIANQVIQERISQATIAEREEPPEGFHTAKRPVFLDILLSSFSDKSGLTLDDIRKEVQGLLFAGHDTSTLALIWVVYLLGKHPNVQIKLQKEVDEMLGGDPDRLLSKEDLYHLKYAECVIKESLRLYPVAPLIARKLSEDISIGEHKIPKGFTCIISVSDLHQNPDIFPCPEKFDPERFLPENCLNRHPYAFIPFSAGPRNCLGQKFAMMEMKVILARMMQKITVESVQQAVEMKYSVTIHPAGPVRLKVKRR